MSDRPIIFSAPLVRALLDGRKTQTRRIIKPQPAPHVQVYRIGAEWDWRDGTRGGAVRVPYAPGDRLWVREAFTCEGQSEGEALFRATVDDDTGYYAEEIAEIRWRPSIHMPRWASRLTLIVTDARVQRLLEISAQDAESEGVFRHVAEHSLNKVFRSERGTVAVEYFRDLWNSLHGPDAWDANPWVCALTFTVQRGNIDQVTAPSEAQNGGRLAGRISQQQGRNL